MSNNVTYQIDRPATPPNQTIIETEDRGSGVMRQVVKVGAASTSVVTQVSSSASNVTLKALNTSRLGLTIFNDSTQILYVKLGTTASSTSYTVKMIAGAYYETPFGYTGIVDGIWASANGFAYVTELT